nr:hypothetical protein [Pandoravirus aubagnensis]
MQARNGHPKMIFWRNHSFGCVGSVPWGGGEKKNVQHFFLPQKRKSTKAEQSHRVDTMRALFFYPEIKKNLTLGALLETTLGRSKPGGAAPTVLLCHFRAAHGTIVVVAMPRRIVGLGDTVVACMAVVAIRHVYIVDGHLVAGRTCAQGIDTCRDPVKEHRGRFTVVGVDGTH